MKEELANSKIKMNINNMCNALYTKYSNKFDDSGRMAAIKGVIDEVRNYGVENLDEDYVREKCTEYEKRMRLPEYTTDDGVTYLTKSFVSLETSVISDAFVSDCSKATSYSFTLNINEYCGNGYGTQVSLVSFSANLPSFFNSECLSFRLSFCIDLVNISQYWKVFSWFTFELGGFIGLGGDIGFSFDYTTSQLEFISKKGVIVGYWWKGIISLNKF